MDSNVPVTGVAGRANHTRARCLVLALGGCLALVGVPDAAAADAPVSQSPSDTALKLTELSLEQLTALEVGTVYGASKREQATTDAPSSVSIVTQEDIKLYGYRTLGDVLRGVRGFYVTYDRSYNFLGVRGINRPGDYGGRALINVDGHRLNDPIYDSAFTDTDFLLDLDLVDRVEVIRGPGSSLYGNNAFFTVINVITRRGGSVDGVEASAAAASYDTYSGRLTYGKQFNNGLELLVSGTYLDSVGQEQLYFPEYRAINNGIAEDLDGTQAPSAFASISYRSVKLEGGFIHRSKHSPAAQYYPYSVFNDPLFLNEDERGYAELKFTPELDEDTAVLARIYYDYYRFDGTYPFNNSWPAPGPTTINRDIAQAEWVGAEAMVSKALWQRHRLTLGGEIRHDFRIAMRNFDQDPPATIMDSEVDAFSYAFYGQEEFTILTNLLLNAGVRYDHSSSFGGTVNPRGALIYSPWREGTFKLLYGHAYRAPNAWEQNSLQPGFKPNPNLGPETIRSYELVYEQRVASHWHLSGSLFLNRIQGLIDQTLDPTDNNNYFANVDEVEARGFEAAVEGRWKSGLRAGLSYTFAQARDTATGAIIKNSPRHLGRANLVVPLWQERLFASLEAQAMSDRSTTQGNEVGEFWIANATLFSRELVKNLELSASVYNLFDKTYRDPVSSDYLQDAIEQNGRQFRVKITYRF